MSTNNNGNKSTTPEKRVAGLSVRINVLLNKHIPTTIPVKLDTPVFDQLDVFFDKATNQIIRINNFGVIEKLDYNSYIEAINTEKQLNDELNAFLSNTRPAKFGQ